MWSDDVIRGLTGPQTVNDSKTPSGRVHVGALRGVLIHDAVYRSLIAKQTEARFLYGVDDYDPLDEIPAGRDEIFQKYLGVPLCNVPPPPESTATDMAEHYIREFFDVFRELDIHPTIYRMRDVYRAGTFDEAIDAILSRANVVRDVYLQVSGSRRPPTWYPFQVVCEQCGRIGTTEVVDYDGKMVTYTCRHDLVKWAKGCGFQGKVSPFGGNGKLPWKLEWVAKWKCFPVTIEGAGKDHSTRGGSRDVAEECLRRLFQLEPPLNIPYEFFLVGGAKMSSSRGVGASARDMADLLPPELLRFLMLRTQPARTVNFSPEQEGLTRLFAEYDRYHQAVVIKGTATDDERRVFALSQVGALDPSLQFLADFDLVLTLTQMPHVNLQAAMIARAGRPLTLSELSDLERRIRSAQIWLARYATPETRLQVQDELPSMASSLSSVQRAFLHFLADTLKTCRREPEAIQSAIFDAARMTPVSQPLAFAAIYGVILGRQSGPKAGNLLAYLDPEFLQRRFRELKFNKSDFCRESSIDQEAFERFLSENRASIREAQCVDFFSSAEVRHGDAAVSSVIAAEAYLDFTLTMSNGQRQMKRVLFERVEGFDSTSALEYEHFSTFAQEFLRELKTTYGVDVRFTKA
jgi:lysyl-tRNA synthetase class 1